MGFFVILIYQKIKTPLNCIMVLSKKDVLELKILIDFEITPENEHVDEWTTIFKSLLTIRKKSFIFEYNNLRGKQWVTLSNPYIEFAADTE